MTLTVIFGDDLDGYVRSADAVYATARTGGVLTAFASLNVGQDNSGIWCQESFIGFDTTGVSAVKSATLSLWYNSGTTQSFTVEARVKDWSTSVDTADWVSADNLAALTEVANWVTTGVTGDYVDFTDVAMVANLNASGFTRLILNSSRHRIGNAPSATDESIGFLDAGTAGTTQDPKLTLSDGVPFARSCVMSPDIWMNF